MIERLFRQGVMLSLHDTAPSAGGQPRLSEPFPLPYNSYAFRDDVLVNTARIRLDPPTHGGTARYLGFWDRDGTFLTYVSIRARPVTPDAGVVIAPRRMRLEMRRS